MKKIMA
jgi:hypothetical protein